MGGTQDEDEEEEEEEAAAAAAAGEEEEDEEMQTTADFELSEFENRVTEWELGLPSADDLMPLSQALIPPELASAFSISPQPSRTTADVHRASQSTLAALHRSSLPRKLQPSDDSPSSSAAADPSARTLKRPRLVWTPQLHKRFVDVVGHLGIKNAVPKIIMQLMNVDGLTRENVASHLQKYRLYLKRMQGLSASPAAPSSSTDQLLASTPVPPHAFHDIPPQILPVPVLSAPPPSIYRNFDSHHHHPCMFASKFGSIVSYSHMNSTDE